MPINATYVSPDTLTALFDATGQKDLREQCPAGVAIKADCGEDGVRYGVVTAVSYDDPVTTIAIAGDALTANLTAFEHGNDTPGSLANHGHTGRADGGIVSHTALGGIGAKSHAQIDAHLASMSNPHGVTAAQAGAKGLISSSTTIYVATTGSDTTGDGSATAPFASISQALASIKHKLIASGVTVTIQVADGTYSITSTIVIDHPDADKIQILGNTSAETTVAIAAIDADAKTITVAGDHTGDIQAGDILGLTGSSTAGLNGAYLVSGVSYDSSNTIISCASEMFASSTVGGGSAVIKPCNRCVLNFSTGVNGIVYKKSNNAISGFRINSASGTTYAIMALYGSIATVNNNIIIYNFSYGLYAARNSYIYYDNIYIKTSTWAIYAGSSKITPAGTNATFDNIYFCAMASENGYVALPSGRIVRANIALSSPSAGEFGNSGSYVSAV